MTDQELALAIQVADTKVGVRHDVLTNAMRAIVIECIAEFCKLQRLEDWEDSCTS